jgi:methyl-accepting chemotaxis protein
MHHALAVPAADFGLPLESPSPTPASPPPTPSHGLLRRITIRSRLFVAFALMCVLLGALGAVAWWANAMQNQAFNLFVNAAVSNLRQGGDLRAVFVETRLREKEFLLSAGDSRRQANALRAWREDVTVVVDGLATIEKQIRQADALVLVKDVRSAYADYARHMETAFAAAAGGADLAAEPVAAALRSADADYGRAQDAMKAAFATFDGRLAEVVKRINGLAEMLVKAILAVLAVAIALAAAAGWAISRSIHQPLREAERFAARLQDGDLTAPMDVRGADEISRLGRALTQMQAGLGRIVSDARRAADNVATSSAQIAAGSMDLSQRTDEQAASLQQTAASLEELASAVQQNADAAQAVRRVSVAAGQAAIQSSDSKKKVVGTMDHITAGSRRIADIIGVIDNIAFRTNILALNAAVESARAGEQGRGFAVVAAEVRSLAQRSAEAAREVRGLISESVRTVDAGNALAADAGSALDSLLVQVRQVDGLIAQITAANIEQSTGVGQVSDAVAQLDRVTQQNAALVEESAAAAASLNQQALQMAGAVAMFRLAR